MKILVTGTNGFIGSALAGKLAEKYDVIGVSNTKKTLPHIRRIKKDIRNLSIKDIPRGVSHIVHLAAVSDLSYCQENPSVCFDVNIHGTQNMLEISRKLGAKFLFASTSHVYGRPRRLPINENHPRNPCSVYAASKLAGEIICESYAKNYGLDLSILRLFSVYGPRSPHHLVISRIMDQIHASSVVKLGNLYPKRDFVYVGDAVAAIELVLRKSSGFETFNIGSGQSHSIKEVCSILQQISGRKTKIKQVSSLKRDDEIGNVVSSISKIARLGWKPKTDIRTGLKIAYEKSPDVFN